MTDAMHDRLIATIVVSCAQFASVAQVAGDVTTMHLVVFFTHGLVASGYAYLAGNREGFTRGLKVMEGLR